MHIDWSLGRYESTAAKLMPAAGVVVDATRPARGERVVDVGCGTGNAALLAAARGAHVTGVDPAQRLLEVARRRAAEQGLEARFVQGEAAALPLDDRSAEIVLSVFGVIFAPDASAVAAEVARVLAPGGRFVLSAWMPQGPISDMGRAAGEAVARAVGAPPGPPPFPWHDREALADLLAPHGFDVAVDEHSLAFTAPSAREFLDAESRDHPMSIATRSLLEARGLPPETTLHPMLEVLEAGNEDPDSFVVTSRYVVATARRG
ncbi:MAG TPA: class I SAM-dependent methyltransferase [Candidatus Dormibacteraeota bacterium]|jgi:SAM-dependent methyltransferase